MMLGQKFFRFVDFDRGGIRPWIFYLKNKQVLISIAVDKLEYTRSGFGKTSRDRSFKHATFES